MPCVTQAAWPGMVEGQSTMVEGAMVTLQLDKLHVKEAGDERK